MSIYFSLSLFLVYLHVCAMSKNARLMDEWGTYITKKYWQASHKLATLLNMHVHPEIDGKKISFKLFFSFRNFFLLLITRHLIRNSNYALPNFNSSHFNECEIGVFPFFLIRCLLFQFYLCFHIILYLHHHHYNYHSYIFFSAYKYKFMQ